MFRFQLGSRRATLCAALMGLSAPFVAQAQAQAQAPKIGQTLDLRADPLNAQARVPPLVYESAFAQYRRLTEVSVGSWRDANDTVARIGGWRAYAREAAQPAAPVAPVAPAAPAAPAATAPSAVAPAMTPPEPAMATPKPGSKDPHSGHKMN